MPESEPAKKRRRPALSCEQCRRRKIKCDRNYPCGQCLQSRASSCNYSDSCPGGPHQASSTAFPPARAAIRIPSRARSIPSTSSTHAPSASLSPTFIHQSNTTHPSSYNSPFVPPGESHQEETRDNTVLFDRIRKLEEQRAISHAELSNSGRSTGSSWSVPNPTPELCGTVSKTRFFGTSHWMYSYGGYDKMAWLSSDSTNCTSDGSNDTSILDFHIKEVMEKCKMLAKRDKALPYTQWLANPDFRQTVPQREISDQMVNAYFRTAESIYRILHIPSFQREYEQYWVQPDAANPVTSIKLLLVMSIGVCFDQGPNSAHYRTEARKWIYAAQAWLSSPFEKAKLNISTIQIQCLLILARQHYSISGDLVWISAGTLLRTAMQMGFHRDPKCLPKMGVLQAEMRRRLWATILELNIQSSIVSGMPFLISEQDWDTAPPANVDDVDISETTTVPIAPKPGTSFTQTSLQIILLQVVRPRLEVIRYANNIRSEPSYDGVLRVGAELLKACRNNRDFIAKVNQTREALTGVTQLNSNLLDLSIRLFLLILHRPFAAKGMKDPHFYFSRKICLEAAVTMLNYPSSEPSTINRILDSTIRDDYAQLKVVHGGFLKGVIVYAVMIVFEELITQLEEEGPAVTEEARVSREPLKQCLRHAMGLAADRIVAGENNVMGHLFLCVAIAHIAAIEAGSDLVPVVLDAAKKSALLCYDLMSARIGGSESVPPVDGASSAGALGDLGGTMDFGMDFGIQEREMQASWFGFDGEDDVWWH